MPLRTQRVYDCAPLRMEDVLRALFAARMGDASVPDGDRQCVCVEVYDVTPEGRLRFLCGALILTLCAGAPGHRHRCPSMQMRTPSAAL